MQTCEDTPVASRWPNRHIGVVTRPSIDLRTPVLPAPMLATAGQPPGFGDDWVVEPRFDGARCAARIGTGRAEPFSRRANNLTGFFPDVVTACLPHAHRDAILDGEIIVLDDRARPNFQLLQHRLHTPRPSGTLQRRLPARFVVFDVLHLNGRDLTGLPYRERRAILEGLDLNGATSEVAASPAWFGADGKEILQAMVDVAMEGIVCKALGSSYRVGQRSRHWIKTPYRRSGHFVVGGYFARGTDSVGALMVGAHDEDGDLIYCATVSVGFTARARRDLGSRLSPLQRASSPFCSTNLVTDDGRLRWVEPIVVGRIEFREFTGRLRHAAWKGEVDVDPSEVSLPQRCS